MQLLLIFQFLLHRGELHLARLHRFDEQFPLLLLVDLQLERNH
jgi:hypothetical protein